MDSAPDDEVQRQLQHALQAIDTVLAHQGEDFSQVSEQVSLAVRLVASARNRLAEIGDAENAWPGLPALRQLNGLLSLLASIEFPLAGIHWPRIRQVREQLQAALPASLPH